MWSRVQAQRIVRLASLSTTSARFGRRNLSVGVHRGMSSVRVGASSSSSSSLSLSLWFQEWQPSMRTFSSSNDNDDDNGNETPTEPVSPDPENFPHPVTIKMPDMGEGNDNRLEAWFKQPGDKIQYNDVLCDITTPDFTFGMVVEDDSDGIMGEILVAEGELADDNAPLCTIWHPPEESRKTKEAKAEEKGDGTKE